MAITKEQALTAQEFHAPGVRPCNDKNGPIRWRRNGKTQTWKRNPERFRVPIKHGLYSYSEITNESYLTDNLHTLEDCPVEGPAMICQDCWQMVRPDQYFPETPTSSEFYVDCARCGQQAIFLARVQRRELQLTSAHG